MLENHNARVLALQTLYSNLFRPDEGSNLLSLEMGELKELNSFSNLNKKLFDNIIKGVEDKRVELENTISELAAERPIKDINTIDLIILEIAIYEGFIEKITPPKVSINEAIELSKKFGGENSRNFVSGVLGKLFEKFNK